MNDYGEAFTLYAFVPIFREQEKCFWQRVAESLNSLYSTHLVISGRAVNRFYSYGKNLTAVPLSHSWINSSQSSEFKSSSSFKTIVSKVQSQASLWDEDYSSDEQLIHASSIALHLSALNPIAVLIWNWHRPEGLLARSIAQSMGIQCWDIERTPWPGMLTLDRRGQLSETRLASSLRIFSNKHLDLQLPLENGLQKYLDRADEFISIIRSNTLTWWQQPGSGISSAREIQQHDDYINSKYKILFAGQVDKDVQNFLFSPHYESNIEAFKAVLNSLPEGSFVVGKHHPMSLIPVSAYQHAIENTKHVSGVWTQDLDVASSLTLVDHVIAVNSSFLFEALSEGKSCFELGTTMLSGLNVFFDCTSQADLKSAISDWLCSPLSDYKKHVLRFRVLTGFALSHGLLSFEDFTFTFKEPDCKVFMMKWADQVLGYKAQHHADFQSKNHPLSSKMSSNSLAAEGLIHYASSVDALVHELSFVAHELSIERSTGVKKSALTLLASIRKSIRRRIFK
jgi:hypothetical protein